MFSRRCAPLLPLVLVGSCLAPWGAALPPAAAGSAEAAPLLAEASSGERSLTKSALRQAAQRILAALRQSDAQALYNLLAEPVRRFSTPVRVQERLASVGGVRSGTIESVAVGADDGTVELRLLTGKGPRELTMVLDPSGQILGWELDRSQLPAEDTAVVFIQELAAGQYVQARSRLGMELQQEMLPATLRDRWLGLQKLTGPFRKVWGSVYVGKDDTQQLVLVTTEFGRLTDNLFVILDLEGHVIGVDFPQDLR
ncbi:MAG: hypothetical protein ACKO5F_16260 [Synechococcus sp.]